MWEVICIGIFVLNVLDGVFTLAALATGNFHEANPLMAFVIDNFGPFVFFYGFKVLFPAIACAFLYRGISAKASHIKKIIIFVFSVYFVLIIWHIYLVTL